MTYAKFLTHLAKFKGKFKIETDGRIRLADEAEIEIRNTGFQGCCCPGLVALQEAYPEQRMLLRSHHLQNTHVPPGEEWRTDVMNAADSDEQIDPKLREIRHDLLTVLELEE